MKKLIFLAYFLALSFLHGAQEKKEEKPYVTCWLKSGQLGNQFFEIATTLAHAWDNQMEPIFPGLQQTSLNLSTNLSRVFFRLNASPLTRPVRHVFEQYLNFEKIDIPVKPDLLLKGYFQTWEYFDHHREKLLHLFAPSSKELADIKKKHADLLKHPFTVGVHVRTFNKQWSKFIPFVGLGYYEKAMDLFPSEAIFVIFSDRINWCRHHFAKLNRPMIFIENQDHIEDFFLMSMLKHNIIGNSSYSWWAAYLNQNPNKIIVAPSHFLNVPPATKANANMPDWLVIDLDCKSLMESYPEDIRNYDRASKSIDTQ